MLPTLFYRTFITTFFLVITCCSATASVENLPSNQSFTGNIFTPNAQVIDTGNFSLSFNQGVPYQGKIAALDDWFLGAGVFPGLEAGGRIVTQSYDCNHYIDKDCGIRDLSASLKYQLPYVNKLTGFNLAFGIQDLGGAASNFDAAYVVADTTFNALPIRISAGYGKSDLSLDVLNGPFGGIEWQPFPFAQLTGEYDASEFNAAAKLFTPDGLLPYGTQASLHYELYSGHGQSEQTLWGVNASVPLVGYDSHKKRYLASETNTSTQQQLSIELAKGQSSGLQHLITALKNEGFINLQFGERDDKLVIALENRRYNRNQMDGVGVALGIIASHAGTGVFSNLKTLSSGTDNASTHQAIELVLLANKIPMLAVTTETECYREFLQSGIACSSLQFQTRNLNGQLAATRWLFETLNEGFGRSQIIVSPALYHNVATEFGFFDYSLALATNLYTPLWQGAALDIRHTLPLAESDDFKEGQIWGDGAFENQIDRAIVHQAFRLPLNFMTQFSAGYVYGGYLGGLNETQWFSPEGYHNFGFEVSHFTYKEDTDERGRTITDKSTALGHYMLSVPDVNWQLKVQGGEFWQGDKGAKITSSHWLGDARLDASYLNSDSEEFVTLGIAIPLTPWRDMKSGYVQLRGIDEFLYAMQTRVGDSHNNLNTGLGANINLQHNLARQYLNRNRLTPVYFEANIQRLRNAYLRYLEDTVN